MVEELPLPTSRVVVDLACGDGFYGQLLADPNSAMGILLGVDVSPSHLVDAYQRAE